MYKRPSQRVKNDSYEHRPAPVGSFLHKLMNPSPIEYPVKGSTTNLSTGFISTTLQRKSEILGYYLRRPRITDIITNCIPRTT